MYPSYRVYRWTYQQYRSFCFIDRKALDTVQALCLDWHPRTLREQRAVLNQQEKFNAVRALILDLLHYCHELRSLVRDAFLPLPRLAHISGRRIRTEIF